MTKSEFNTYRDICKSCWQDLADSGDKSKMRKELSLFLHFCPACDIAAKVAVRDDGYQDCRYCPITRWRNIAIKDGSPNDSGAICHNPGEPYGLWLKSNTQAQRSELAEKISKLRWSWMPEYIKI
jgi:hypothetical protein